MSRSVTRVPSSPLVWGALNRKGNILAPLLSGLAHAQPFLFSSVQMVFHAAGNIGDGGAACEQLDELSGLIHEIDNIGMIDRIVARAFGRFHDLRINCLLYTSPSPRDATLSRMPSSA